MKKILKRFSVFFILSVYLILLFNIFIINGTRGKIIEIEDIKKKGSFDCILILGAGLQNGKPSKMLQERLDTGIDIYKTYSGNKILMSGDHTRENHDEVNAMKYYAFLKDIPTEDVFMDHAGVSTFNSLLRARDIFGAKKILIVTQEYHLYRALYIAESLGIEAYGVNATKKNYLGQSKREVREILARIKDMMKAKVNLVSVYNEKKIPLTGNGNRTNDYSLTIIDAEGRKRFLKKSNAYYQLKKIMESNQMEKSTCSATPKYTISYEEKNYQVEIEDDMIHIRDNENEIKLDKEDSKILFDIILASGIF